jgi:hypothetical protein
VTDPAFIRWWRTQMVPPDPTPAQLRAWARRAWEAATERAALAADEAARVYRTLPTYRSDDVMAERATGAGSAAAAIRAGAHLTPTTELTRGGSPRDGRRDCNAGNPGV